MVRTHTRKMGEIAPGVPPQGAKTCFVFCYQGNAAFRPHPALISTVFETTNVNRFPHVYTGGTFSNFCAENFPGPKQTKIDTLW